MKRRTTVVSLIAASTFAFAAIALPSSQATEETVAAFPVISSTSVGSGPTSMALSTDGRVLYVAGASRTLAAIDTATGDVTAKTSLGAGPGGIMDIATPDWYSGVVVWGYLEQGFVYLVNGSSLEVERVVDVPVPFTVAIHPTQPLLYVMSQRTGLVEVVDVNSGAVVNSFEAAELPPRSPGALRISPDGKHLYWRSSDGLAIADSRNGQLVAALDLGLTEGEYSIFGFAMTAAGDHAFLVAPDSPTMLQKVTFPGLDGVRTYRLRERLGSRVMSVVGDDRYVVSIMDGNKMSVLDLENPDRRIESVLSTSVVGLLPDATTKTLWAANYNDSSVMQFDVAPPKPPKLQVVAEGVPGGATVTWAAKNSQAWVPGAAKTTAVARPGGKSCSSMGSSCTIGGLERGEKYVIRVISENISGRSPVGRARVVVPDVKPPKRPAPPGKPNQEVS